LNEKESASIQNSFERLSELELRFRLDVKRLKGVGGREDLFRLRVGDYRIIFFEDEESVKVTQIIQRGKGYDWL
jgi:mRNA-degrading endonuclease RelE of RelBE toxin-antitoxin system